MGEIVEVGQAQHTPAEILELFARWMRLDTADGNASVETLRAYASDVRQHLAWLVEHNIAPSVCTEDDLKAYRAYLVSQYAVSTAGRKLVAVRQFYRMAHSKGYIHTNPGDGLRSPVDRTNPAERIKYVPEAGIRRLLAMPEQKHGSTPRAHRDRSILSLMAIHGLRTVEVHRLDVGNIDRQATAYGALHIFGKGSKWRTVALIARTRDELNAWLADRDLLDADTEAVFVTLHWGRRKGETSHHRISTRSIRSAVDGYMEAVGVKGERISCHALRHSCATLAHARGADIYDLAQLLGHADVATTGIYTEIVNRDERNPSRLLEDLLEAEGVAE